MPEHRVPRRIVLLAGGEASAPEATLAGQRHPAVSGDALHADLRTLADAWPGRLVAAEWWGRMGWTRYVWVRREAT